jgi:saccharopine dehydrogenase-like NADP-dependent oxidoreductase
MSDRILIIGGTGRIGQSVAQDIAQYTNAEITITGRSPRGPFQVLPLDLADRTQLQEAIAQHHLVIHCAGPFRYRDQRVLETCIKLGVNYLDVCDDPEFCRQALALKEKAITAGVTAIVSTGVFPGISNSMARQAVETLDTAESIHLSYVVAGSGGAGVTVMRTTFLELQHSFDAWIDGCWQPVKPYSDREIVEFPAPYGRAGVYWFQTIEAATLPLTFPVKTVVTKFGSAPDFYNYLTGMVAQLPPPMLENPNIIEFLSQASYAMTQITDKFTGIGLAMRAEAKGFKNGQPAQAVITMVHENTARAAGAGTGSVAELILSGQGLGDRTPTLRQPGVWLVEQALGTDLFTQTMQKRQIPILTDVTA